MRRCTGRERLALARENDSGDVGRDGLEGAGDLFDKLLVEGVVHLGLVHRDAQHVALRSEFQVLKISSLKMPRYSDAASNQDAK